MNEKKLLLHALELLLWSAMLVYLADELAGTVKAVAVLAVGGLICRTVFRQGLTRKVWDGWRQRHTEPA
jgi:hypothetical protein